jgi:hypothetical protein
LQFLQSDDLSNLWGGNIMVDSKNVPWIIGTGYMPYKHDTNLDWMFQSHGKRQSNDVGAIYSALVSEGLVKVVLAEGSLPPNLLSSY